MPKSHPEALAENAVLRGQLHNAEQRNKVLARIARQQNDALMTLLAHMATHMQEPSTPHAEGPCPPARTTPEEE